MVPFCFLCSRKIRKRLPAHSSHSRLRGYILRGCHVGVRQLCAVGSCSRRRSNVCQNSPYRFVKKRVIGNSNNKNCSIVQQRLLQDLFRYVREFHQYVSGRIWITKPRQKIYIFHFHHLVEVWGLLYCLLGSTVGLKHTWCMVLEPESQRRASQKQGWMSGC